ncbi:MAG: glycosyltransferase family 1 protein [Actinomycetota bacterium]|nr:glycosyltransferase family 1 protein [Actinomycetota bacterium]
MRVAINVEQLLSPSPGGIGRYTAQLVMLLRSIAPADDPVPFVARHRPSEVAAALTGSGLGPSAVVLPFPRPLLYETWVRFGLPALRWGAPELRGVDLVHAPSVAVPGRSPAPLVVTVHDAAPELFPDAFTPRGRRWHARGAAAAARRADLVIVPSAAAGEEVVELTPVPAERVRVVHHAVCSPASPRPLDASRRQALGIGDAPYVLWVGSLEPRKGLATLIEAMAALGPAGRRGCRLVLAGFPGWLPAGLVPDAARKSLGADLLQVGRVDDATLWGLLAGAAVFAFPSRHEGFGLPPLEAMSQGAPVVASDLPVLREVLGPAALYVPPGRAEAWAARIAELLGDDGARAEMSAAGRARAALFDPERFVGDTRTVYREVLGG